MNIHGKFYDILCRLYAKNSLCIRIGEYYTDFFEAKVGVRQGDVLNPDLFKMFIKDLPEYLTDSSLY